MSRIIRIRGRGDLDVLRLEERDVPEPKRGQVRVRVEAAGVAYGDVMRRRGILAPPFVSFTPGYDVTGVVEAIGPGVNPSWEGTRVAAMMPTTGFGGYAEHVVLSANRLARVPDNVSATQAGALILNYITAWQILEYYADVPEGGTLLVHGGAGGVGTAVLQLARLRGIKTYATASAPKHDLVRSLGAEPIDYRSERFEDVIAETCPGGVDAILDSVGGENLTRSWTAVRPGGTVVSFGTVGELEKGWWAFLTAAWMMLGLWMDRSRSLGLYLIGTRYAVHEDLQRIMDLAGEGQIEPIIGEILPLEEVSKAHDLLEQSAVVGKIVLTL